MIFSTDDYKYNFDDWVNGKNRILYVLGYSGSGKTTLSDKLAKEYDCTVVHMDEVHMYLGNKYGRTNWKSKSKEERNKLIWTETMKRTGKGRAIVDGGPRIIESVPDLKKESFIIMGTSQLLAAYRLTKRTFSMNNKQGIPAFLRIYKDTPKILILFYMLNAVWSNIKKHNYELADKLDALKENYIVQETNNSFSANSNFIINEDDIYCNMGRFLKKSPEQVNICFVTGFSGSGKSTIAKKLANYHKITYVELDYFSFRGARRPFTEKDCKDSGHEIIWKYIKAKHLSPDFLVGKDKHKVEWIEAIVKFVSWLETMRGNYVVEGIQCTYIIPANPKWLDYPIIFKGTSMISSLIRGIKRDEIIDLKDIRQSVIDIIDRLQWFYRSKSGFDNIRNSMITKDNHREVSASVWDGVNEMVNESAKPSHEEMPMMMEVKYNDKDKYHLNQYVSEHGCYPEFMMDIAMEASTPTYDEYTTESFFISNDNTYYNFDKWEDGDINILLVTGYSGGGKSTLSKKLSKKYNCDYIEIDTYGDKIKKMYPECHNMSKDERRVFVLRKIIEMYKGKDYRVIIEGAQIAQADISIDEIKDFAIIIVGTSVTTATLRAWKRAFKDPERLKLWHDVDSDLGLLLLVLSQGGNRFKYNLGMSDKMERFIDSVKSISNESYDFTTEASTPPEVHTDKLDLRGMTFIHASHRPDSPPTENSCLMMNGKKYRVRVETLIYNDKGEIYAAKRDKPTCFCAFYKIPGGSAEPGKTLEQQAIAESQEEVRANVKNIKFTGIWYINEFDDIDNSRLGPDTVAWLKKVGLKYDGFITVLFVAKYAGKFNGHIKKVDQVDWIKDVKFHDPKDLNLIEPHKMALQKIWFNTNSLSK